MEVVLRSSDVEYCAICKSWSSYTDCDGHRYMEECQFLVNDGEWCSLFEKEIKVWRKTHEYPSGVGICKFFKLIRLEECILQASGQNEIITQHLSPTKTTEPLPK